MSARVIAESVRAAPAKVNLFLEILGQRADGFHDLETVFQTISLADTVSVRCLEGPAKTTVTYDQSAMNFGVQDLAFRAVEAYRFYCSTLLQTEVQIDVRIEKRIPLKAGLGGGSSDAAAVLRALMEIFPVEKKVLHAIALSLGSDVPFFLLGGTAYATGRGENLIGLSDFSSVPMYVVTPQTGNATAEIFTLLNEHERAPRTAGGYEAWIGFTGSWPDQLFNRLSRSARVANTELDQLCHQLDASGARWLMSGSGSSCFVCSAQPPPVLCTFHQVQFRSRADLNSCWA